MPTYELPPDTGHESDFRAVGSNGLYLKPRQLSGNAALIAIQAHKLEQRAKEHPEGSYGYRELMGHAANLRDIINPAPVLDEADPADPQQEENAEELAHLGCANTPTEEAAAGCREVSEDDGAAYGETAEEAFQRD